MPTDRPESLPPLLAPPGMTVLTGAGGWFGQAYLRALAEPAPRHGPVGRSGTVRALVRDPAEVPGVLAALPGCEVHVGDVADEVVVARLLDGADGASVVHAAGVIHPERVADFERVNVGGTRTVLDAAARAGARRVVHVSSNSPFGVNVAGDRFRQHEPYRPVLGYGGSKMRGEQAALARHDPDGLETVVVRPPWFQGPHLPERQVRFLRMVRAGRFPVPGSGEQQRSVVHVDNLVQGVAFAERCRDAGGQAFWVADPEPLRLVDIVSTVQDAFEAEGLTVRRGHARLPAAASALAERADAFLQARGRYVSELHVMGELRHSIACDVSATRDVLGYAPRVGLLDGTREAIRWCLAHGVEL
ncbi:NAD-dependent epimerase/dehydratase family protein [Nocardioides zeicaulis]|uniref:NAD-dependent epimerase/dehydratase family protein n=1 Tax=Nocardioides zeicaulis TaxID=1776857 RepID=A0ABV6E707_9ACTN